MRGTLLASLALNLFRAILVLQVAVYSASKNCSEKSDLYKFGQWIPGAKEHCGLLDRYNASAHVMPYSDWCWKPHGCNVQKFSASNFCRVMKGKSLLIVGDSVCYQMYAALYKQIASEHNVSPQY